MGSKSGPTSTSSGTTFTNSSTSGSSTGVSSNTPDPLAGLAYQQVLRNAAQIANTPYQPYSGQQVAGFTPDMTAGFQGVRNMQGVQSPYISQAGNLYEQSTNQWRNPELENARNYFGQSFTAAQNPYLPKAEQMYGAAIGLSGMENFNQQALNRYMNPYQQSVVDATLAQMKQNQDVLQNQNTANAVRQGAYGGSGQFMGQAELGRQQALANAQTLAQLNAANYQQAMGQYNQQQQQAIQAQQAAAQGLGQLGGQQAGLLTNAYQQAAQTMGQLGQQQQALGVQALQNAAAGVAGLGKQAQQASLADAQALMQTGEMQRALQQAQLDKAYEQWQQARAYPYQQTSYFAGLAQGLGPLMGQYGTQAGSSASTTSGTEIGNKTTKTSGGGGGIPGLITSGLGILSALKDGGVVKDRSSRELGGPLTKVGELPYGKGPINMAAGYGSLMGKTPFSDAPDNYIAESEKAGRVIKPARELASEKLQSEIDKALGAIPKGKKSSSMDLSEESSGGGSEGSGIGDIVKKASGLVKKFDSGSDVSTAEPSKGFDFGPIGNSLSDFGSSLSSIFSADGGRIGKADGGSFADQAQQASQAQQQAQDIINQYRTTLGRNPEQSGFDYWAQQAAQGRTPRDIASVFANSPERMRQVREAYADVLGRAPESGGYEFWADKARQGMSFGDLQNFIKRTPESLYHNILDRAPDAKGFDFWNKEIAKRSNPVTAELDFLNSPEYLAKLKAAAAPQTAESKVKSGWGALDPSGGLNKALAREKMIAPLDKPMSNYEMLLQQARQMNPGPQLTPEQQGMPSMPGPEYYSPTTLRTYEGVVGGNKNLAGSMDLSPLTAGTETTPRHEEFVKNLFRNYLTREPSKEELGAKLAELSAGMDPAKMEADVLGSKEGRNTSYIQGMYQDILGRPADLGGLEYWKGRLQEGLAAPDLANWFRGSTESSATPAMFKSNAPVQGYFTSIADNQFNPYTGLFNLKYTAPYRGSTPQYDLSAAQANRDALLNAVQTKLTSQLPKADGGRVDKAAGGGLSGKSLYDYLISIGANPKEAAMLTGNAKVESSFNPYVMHDNNTGYGLWGHGKDRWADMQKYTGQRKPGWEDQAKFALWELRNSPKAALARQTLAKADNAQEVAIAGMHYERPQGYRPSTPWAGKNWQQRFSNVASLMGGKDIGSGSVLPRINPNDPSGPLLDTAGPTQVAAAAPRPGFLPRLIKALSPISSAEAAESQPSTKAEEKPMFAWPTLRNPRMNNLPDALGWSQQAALPEWKKEVQTGFGPLQGEKPADEAQLLAEPSRHTAMGPEMPEEKVVAEDRAADKKSGKKYWGDWRDAEPWASDPIGGFFDALTGEEKRADKPGKYEPEQGFDIGSLFGFADGGVVRRAYANGGGEDDFVNPLEELGLAIEEGFGGLFGGEAPRAAPAKREAPEQQKGLGDLLGDLFGGGSNDVVAQDRPAPTGQRGFLPPAVSQALIAAGLGMMASPRTNPFEAIGQGGLQGFQVYSELADQERKREEAAAQQRAAEAYQRSISGEPPVAEDQEAAPEKIAAPASEKPSTEEAAPSRETPTPKVEAPTEIDVESDPEIRRLNSQLSRVASSLAPKGMESVKNSQISNLKFQIEQRRRELESKIKTAEKAKAAEMATPEAKARAKQQEVEQEALAKEAVGIEQEAKQADQRIATLSRMKEAVSSEKFRTGAFAEKELAVKKAIQSVFPGLVDEEAIAMAEQFDKDALRAVTDATGGKLGAGVSDSDVRFLTRQQAGLGTTKAGNVRTLEAAIKIEQRKKDIAQFARDYKKAHNGVLDSGYYQELQQWAEAHPMFAEEKGVKAEDRGASQEYTPEERAKAAEILRRRREGKQ